MGKQVTIVFGDDWKGLYINGKLALQGHDLLATDVLDVLKIKYAFVEPNEDWLGKVGLLPEKLTEVKKEE